MDKRPLGIIGAVFFLTVLVFTRFGFEKSVYILPVFLLAVFLVFFKQKKLQFFAVVASSVLCASLIFGAADLSFRTNEQYFSGKKVAVEGVICERPYTSVEKQYMIIKTDKVNGENVSMKIRVSALFLPEDATLYNRVKLKANLYKVDSYDDEIMRSFKSKGICLTGSAVGGTIKAFENQDKPFMYHVLSFRYRLYDTIKNYLPNETGGFIAGITMGDKFLMSDELVEKFRITGTSHILVVSGLHIAMWSGFLYWVLSLFFTKRTASFISIVFVLLFIAFSGFTPSVVRAGVMMILNYTAIICGEKPDSLNTLGIAALILTAFNPFAVYNVGTVFSFASVLGIILMFEYVYPKVEKKLNCIKNKIVKKILVGASTIIMLSLSAQIFTYPVSVLYNIKFSFLSVISNFLISSLSTLAMVTGGIGTVVISFIPGFFAGKISFGTSEAISNLILRIIDRLSVYESFYKSVTTMENYVFLALVFLLILILVFVSVKVKRNVLIFVSFLIPVILISNFGPRIYKSNVVDFSVIDVGDGMCVALTYNDEAVLLSCSNDYGAKEKITHHLSFRGVNKIEAVYLPVNRSTSLVEGVRALVKDFPVESVVTSAKHSFPYISENITSADYVEAEYFGGKAEISYYTMKKASFALVKVGSERMLINFYGSLSEENLPLTCVNPDVYVTMYGNSYKTDFTGTKDFVISTSYKATYPVTAENVHVTMNDSTYTKLILV